MTRTTHARTLRPLQAVACAYRIAFGPRAGQKVFTVQSTMPSDTAFAQALCADVQGFSLHAASGLIAPEPIPVTVAVFPSRGGSLRLTLRRESGGAPTVSVYP